MDNIEERIFGGEASVCYLDAVRMVRGGKAVKREGELVAGYVDIREWDLVV